LGSSPIPGLSLKRTPDGKAVIRLHYLADPDLNESVSGEAARARLAEIRKKFSSEAFWNLEMEIKYNALDGALIYPTFSRETHVIPDEQIPSRLCRYMAIDPHPRTPHAMLWAGIDRWGDVYLYRELWPSKVYGSPRTLRDTDSENEFTTKEYAETVAMLEGAETEWHAIGTEQEYAILKPVKKGQRLKNGSTATRASENIIARYMDQAGKGFRVSAEGAPMESMASRYNEYGIQCQDPYKIHQAGEDAVREWLKPRRHESKGLWPRLHVGASLIETIFEFERLRYKPMRRFTDERELSQEPIESRRHMMDLVRYLAVSNLTYIPSMES